MGQGQAEEVVHSVRSSLVARRLEARTKAVDLGRGELEFRVRVRDSFRVWERGKGAAGLGIGDCGEGTVAV